MISLFGNISLYGALIMSLLQCILPFYGYYKANQYALYSARVLTFATTSFIVIAYLLLTAAFLTNDFSIIYVAKHSHEALPFMYRITALWGAHEGSMLLWIMALQLWSLFYIKATNALQTSSLVLAILGGMSFVFLLFLLITSNPFINASYLLQGQDLNPLLQDPGFILHPPFLFMGYVGFSVSFAIALSTLLQKNISDVLLIARQFALAAWSFLTIGILLGALWAYRVLGWGGFWFWDPVENASLLPWLTGIALIHVLIVAHKNESIRPFALLLAMMTFSLSLLGTFLVRSGVLISVHTFASDPSRGIALLLILGLLVTVGLIIYLWRLPQITVTKSLLFSFFSKEIWLLAGSLLWLVAMLTILLGTLYPLIIDVLKLGMLSVGAPYFNSVLLPIIALILALMSLSMVALTQRKQCVLLCFKRTFFTWTPILFLSIFYFYYLTGHFLWWFAILLSLSIAVLLSHVMLYRYLLATTIAHIGFAVMFIGILLSSVLSVEREIQLKEGESSFLGPYRFTLLHTKSVSDSNYHGIGADILVMKNDREVTRLFPEKRIYPVRDMVMTKVDIHPGIFRDLYVALGEPINDTTWTMRLYYKPFIRWILFGVMMMAFGSSLAFLRLHRLMRVNI